MIRTILSIPAVTSQFFTRIPSSQHKTLYEPSLFRSRELAQKKAKVGRPRMPKGEAKGRIVPVRFTGDDLKAIAIRAKAADQNVSEWIRSTIHATLERE
jgi:hypothetical protein